MKLRYLKLRYLSIVLALVVAAAVSYARQMPVVVTEMVAAPWVFSGYRSVYRPSFSRSAVDPKSMREVWRHISDSLRVDSLYAFRPDTLLLHSRVELETRARIADAMKRERLDALRSHRDSLTVAYGDPVPSWLRNSMMLNRIAQDYMYITMVENPYAIEYAYWDLPVPPRLPEEDMSFKGYLKRLNLPDIAPDKAIVIKKNEIGRYNWLHTLNTALQLSQAYVSGNWYQGGTSYLAFLANFLWDVQLNQVYYPNLMFQSTVSYKLSVNSTPDDLYHKYSISQDLFQYNLKFGYKAVHNWYYALTAQFKTQFFNSFPANSRTKSASFLSPGDLNLGVGMTYSKENAKKTIGVSVSIAPVSYNLKTCIDADVEHSQFGIKADRRSVSEYGSNATVNFYWKLRDNILYTTKLYAFTDYKSFQGDWENTLNFQFNKLFSTQVYAHLRYDSLADSSVAPEWHKWMLKEILSVGLSYTFSTK